MSDGERLRAVDEPGSEAEKEEPKNPLQRWILPYIEDSTLWPVLIVVVAHAVAFVAPVLLFAFRDNLPVGWVASALLAIATYRTVRYEKRVQGKIGAVTVLVASVWVLSAVAAWFADSRGFL